MNKITLENGNYYLQCEGEKKVEVGTYFEKKSGITWIKLPKDNASGRQYISTSKVVNNVYKFETKTTGPRTLVVTWNWKSRMTEEEAKRYQDAQDTIETIRAECMTRKPVELTEAQKLEADIQKLKAKLNKLKG